jgi:hypothetical protein
MLGDTYQHDLLRKFTIAFGALFDNIYINRHDDAGDVEQKMKIPVSYGPKDKMLARVQASPTGMNQVAITLPRITFEMKTVSYDPARKMINKRKIIAQDPTVDPTIETIRSTYNPVAYNIGFTLWVMTKTVVDGTRIIEQILPVFKPQYTLHAELIPEMGISHDIPIILDSVTVDDQYEGAFEKRRAIVWTLQFMLKGYLYGEVSDTGLIKRVEAVFRDLDSQEIYATTTVQPGLTANGEPTSNVALSIPYADIKEDDNWAYIIDLEADE